jgi:ATP-dependent DNA ligase
MALRLPSPMLARSGAIPSGDYSFEVKWDGFRALVSRNGDFQVRSRRGWNMTPLLPELGDLPAEAVFDGEIVAFSDGRPHFPLVCDRILHRDSSIPLTYVIFDLLAFDGEATTHLPYRERRQLLENVKLGSGLWFVAETFDDGRALFAAVCEQAMEGVVAKRRSQRYRPGERAWIKTKNKSYWRYPEELESLRRSLERRYGSSSARSSAGAHSASSAFSGEQALRHGSPNSLSAHSGQNTCSSPTPSE